MAKLRTAKTSEYLKYEFSADEARRNAKDLARQNQAAVELELKKKQLAADIKAEADAACSRIATLARWVNDGYDFRPIDCEIRFNDPIDGKKTIVRTDTGEVVKEIDMLPVEMQDELELEQEQGTATAEGAL